MIPRTRDALSQLLARTFPHSTDIDPATLDAFIDTLMQVRAGSCDDEPDKCGPPGAHPHEHSLYTLRATHARRTPVTSVFTAVTHCVRVRLPRREPTAIHTLIGVVLPGDHLLPTIDAVQERFGGRLGRTFERIDLVTPARLGTIRFSPMSLYFGYEQRDSPTPNFVIYEPGDAIGKPGALYLGETIEAVIEEQAGYKPTPLSSPEHWYTGGIRMAENGRDPAVLHMQASELQGGEPHFRLHVEYEIAQTLPVASPGGDLVEAALRMLAVEKGVGVDLNVIERLIAETGLAALQWIDSPDDTAANAGAGAHGNTDGVAVIDAGPFVPAHAFDNFLVELAPGERASFEASIAMLLSAVVRADGKFDRLERIEIDWAMNIKVPSALGDAFRHSEAAEREYTVLLGEARPADGRSFERRLAELAGIVDRLPTDLRNQYTSFVREVCRDAAEASGGWLWFGTKVGAQEKEVLDQIAAALGLHGA